MAVASMSRGMSQNLRLGAGWLALAVLSGCGGSVNRIEAPVVNPADAGAQAMTDYDTNHDGVIAGAELDAVPSLKQALPKIEGGRVTADSIADRIKGWGPTALMQVQARVTMDGKPLADAEVKFIPEKFVGPNVAPAQGKTDATGVAVISGPGIEKNGFKYTGVNSGFYRIEVTKLEGGKQIVPERYNTKSTLGTEVAMGNDVLLTGVRLELKSK